MKKQLIWVLALSTMLSVVLTGCGSSKNESSATSTNSNTEETSSSSVDTSSFTDFTVEGIGHKVTFKYDNDAYELEAGNLNANGTVNMYVEVNYLLSDPFDLEFSIETM